MPSSAKPRKCVKAMAKKAADRYETAGAMGSALLERLKLANFEVRAFDIADSAMAAAQSMGAAVTSSARALAAESTLIDVVVRTDRDVEACILGRDGLLEGARPGTLVLLHSTIRPETTRKVAAAAAKRGIDLIDAFHPQTILAFALNDRPLRVANGAPLRLRVERHLGYKQAKYLMGIEAVESLDGIGRGKGGFWEDHVGYDWYAGI